MIRHRGRNRIPLSITEGTIWIPSMIRIKPGMEEMYWRDILPMRKKIDEKAKKMEQAQVMVKRTDVRDGSQPAPAAGRADLRHGGLPGAGRAFSA
jgi:hypothetical protein